MRLHRLAVPTFVAIVAGAALAAPIDIPDQYDMHELAASDAAREIAQCVGAAKAEGAEKFVKEQLEPKAVGSQAQFALERGPAAAVVSGGKWACVRFSADGFPVWPVETLKGAVVAVGAAPDLVHDWRRRMLEAVAREGVARGLIVYENGAATQVNVIGDARQAYLVKYTTRYMKKGEYTPEQFHAVLTDPNIKSLVTTSTGGQAQPSRFAIPPARLRKPVEGDYVAMTGSETTANFDFTATKWKFGNGSELWMQQDGLAILSSSRSSDNGTWSVANGVVHVALAGGARYAMVLGDDRRTMLGEGRRQNKPSHEEDDGEWRWSFKVDKL
jgi:hypothetical protein